MEKGNEDASGCTNLGSGHLFLEDKVQLLLSVSTNNETPAE